MMSLTASYLSYNQASWTHVWVHVLQGSSSSHCPKLADDQYTPAEFESRLKPDLPSIPTIIDLRLIDLVSSPVLASPGFDFKVKDRFEAESFPVSTGPPSGGR